MYRPQNGRHYWRCTHGGWTFESNDKGIILDSWFCNEIEHSNLRGYKIIKFFNTPDYMKEFGNDNPYE